MNEAKAIDLSVKTFIGQQMPSVTLVDTFSEARKLFREQVDNPDCTAAYIYFQGRIVASWDSHTQYLVAIGDIEIDENGCVDGEPYGDHTWAAEVAI